MTGQHTGRTPIWGNTSVKPTGQEPLPDSTATVAKILKAAGYRTGMLGAKGRAAHRDGGPERPAVSRVLARHDSARRALNPGVGAGPVHGRRGKQHLRGTLVQGWDLCRCLEKNLSPNRADARHQFCEGERNLFIYSSLTA